VSMCYETLPKTRKEAKEQGSTRYFTGKPCKRGHVAPRWTRNSDCEECNKQRASGWHYENREVANTRRNERYYLNRDEHLAKCKEYAEQHKEWRQEYNRTYRSLHQERLREYSRAYQKQNLWRFRAAKARYRASKNQATPFWVNQEELRKVYETCPEGYHVDHIVPLNGEQVCGLHVPWNLRHVPAEENLRKSNQLLPELVQ
jgi:hypothetical protein